MSVQLQMYCKVVLFLCICSACAERYSAQRYRRIINGRPVPAGARHPASVSLRTWSLTDRQFRHFCGGVIIHVTWILTAAHCFPDRRVPVPLKLQIENVDTYRVQKLVLYPRQNGRSFTADLALLRTIEIIQGTPALLPQPGYKPRGECQVCGLGTVDPHKHVFPKSLHCATVPVVERDECQQALGPYITLQPGTMCAGGGDADACVMTVNWYKFVTIVVAFSSTARSANFLGIFPIPAKSHNIVFTAVTRELARRGHQVTVISSFPEQTPTQNLKEIEVPMLLSNALPPDLFDTRHNTVIEQARDIWNGGLTFCATVLQHPEVQKLIHSKHDHFDAVIVEAFGNECLLGFAHKFKAAIIQICPFGGTHWMTDWVGNPSPYAYIPDPFLHFTQHMNFWERLVNTLSGVYLRIGQEFYNIPRQEAVMKQFFNFTEPLPPLAELVRKTSLLLVNNHFSLNYPKALMPNLIEVGGMHVQPPKELPQDLQKFLDEAPHGVIYFSMGSVLQGSNMPESVRNAFVEAFSKLKQRVLWKWETDSLPGQPSNVKLGKWLPQSDILAHPNVKLFITHGGLLSKQEALAHGVPLLGLPVYGDQRLNMLKAEICGYGILLEFDNVTTDSVLWAIRTALQPRYRENAQRLSRIYQDQPQTPLQRAVFWTEYVVRHKGAPHLRSAVLDLSWYQYFLLDVIAVLATTVCAALAITFFIFRAGFRTLCNSASKTKSTKQNKKRN